MKFAGLDEIEGENYIALRYGDDVVDIIKYSLEQYNDPMVRVFEHEKGRTSDFVKQIIETMLKEKIKRRSRFDGIELKKARDDLVRLYEMRNETFKKFEERKKIFEEEIKKLSAFRRPDF